MDPPRAAFKEHLRLGDAAYSANRFAEAATHFQARFLLLESPTASGLSQRIAECYQYANDYPSALLWAERAIAQAGVGSGESVTSFIIATCQLTMGAALGSLDRTTEAIYILELALHSFGQLHETEYEIRTLMQLSTEFTSVGLHEKSLLAIDRADTLCAAVSVAATDPERFSIIRLNCLDARGTLLAHLERHEEALAVSFTAHELVKALSGCSIEYATSLSNLGKGHFYLMLSKGNRDSEEYRVDWATVLQYYQRAGREFVRLGAQDSPGCAANLKGMGWLQCDGGQFLYGLENYNKALAVYRRLYPPSHANVLGLLTLISEAHAALGHDSEASSAASAAAVLTRRSQTHCAGPGCARRLREDGAPRDVCVKCRDTFYCGKACQTADWKREGGHKAECKVLIAMAAAAAEAAGTGATEKATS